MHGYDVIVGMTGDDDYSTVGKRFFKLMGRWHEYLHRSLSRTGTPVEKRLQYDLEYHVTREEQRLMILGEGRTKRKSRASIIILLVLYSVPWWTNASARHLRKGSLD